MLALRSLKPTDFRHLYIRIYVSMLGISSLRQPYKIKRKPISGHHSFFTRAAHSLSLNPTRTKSSPTSSGRLTSMPSVARRRSISSSLIWGNLSFSPIDLYSRPLVLKNFFSGRPLCSCHAASSSQGGFSSLISRKL